MGLNAPKLIALPAILGSPPSQGRLIMTTEPWWKTATGYQIYPRSFCDSNGDGIGDIAGIISKLDHLADLGVGFVWLSPVYASPMRDNGYDISDYRAIAPEFGTLDDMDDLIAQARARGIRIVMDLVVNHCSSDHAWFKTACTDATAPEHDYFYWRPAGPDGGPPDDQRGCFGGSAWVWVEAVGKYYYGHFGPQQPDLNWQNPALRAEIYDMMNWWLDRGIGGFRMDVIDLIGKDLDARIYAEGPDLHRFLQEMHRECLQGRDIMTVGETWSVTPQTALDYCGADRKELNMVFNFNHIEAAWDPVRGKFGYNAFDLVTHKTIMTGWQTALAEDGWNSLYLSNHDLPRAVSTYGNDTTYRVRSAKALGLVTHLMKGTPFIYQGEEIGMTNVPFDDLSQFRDIETLGIYEEKMAEGMSHEDFLAGARVSSRDNARTPMQWTAGEYAGFSNVRPWIDVNPNKNAINVALDRADPDGVFDFYAALTRLRHTHPVIVQGGYEPLAEQDPAVFAYLRRKGPKTLLVVANLSADAAKFEVPEALVSASGTCLLGTIAARDALEPEIDLEPYEGFAWLI